jgi:regulator of protease activity HflC (stomatin/prohibitin superfamily)
LFLVLIAVIIFLRGIRIVREDHRLVVFRLGRFFRIAGPGLVLVFSFIDQAIQVDLNTSVPQWLSMSKEQLEDQLKNTVLSGAIVLKK